MTGGFRETRPFCGHVRGHGAERIVGYNTQDKFGAADEIATVGHVELREAACTAFSARAILIGWSHGASSHDEHLEFRKPLGTDAK